MQTTIDLKQLREFIGQAGAATYAGGGAVEEKPEKEGFIELVYAEGDLVYRDSYTGYHRSRGMELIRKDGKPIWASLYGGGMIEGKEELADATFDFLKKAMSADNQEFDSFRGPREFTDGDFKYSYAQEGDVKEFNGHEEIRYRGKLVFFHRIIGGIIQGQ